MMEKLWRGMFLDEKVNVRKAIRPKAPHIRTSGQPSSFTMAALIDAPQVEQRLVCIAAEGQTPLAAQISSYFSEPGRYFALFEFIAIDRPYEEVPQRDGYFAQILAKRAANAINNCLVPIQPSSIVLLGLTEAQQSYLRVMLPEEKLITVNSEEELLALPFAAAAGGAAHMQKLRRPCRDWIAAKRARKPLVQFGADDAPDLPNIQLNGKASLIVVENREEVGDVTIINYAAAIDADIVLVEPVERDETHSIARQLHAWAKDRSSGALGETRRKITCRIKDLDFAKYRFATFFTAGLPYGLVLKNIIPLTHVLNGPHCGVFITNAINEEFQPVVGSALLFSINEFEEDETDDVGRRLDENDFVITALIGRQATNRNLSNFGSHLPYDLLHICSHGGETDGYFVKQPFTDRDGKEHMLEYFEVVSFGPGEEPDMVKVERKMLFAALDGVAWADRPLSRYPRYVGDDLMQALREDKENLKRMPVNVPIALSCHIQCHQSIHQGAFDTLAAYAHPIVFNNSCSSSNELAASFLAAGARGYLGTLWYVGSKTAKMAAISFYDNALSTTRVLDGVTAMLRSIDNPAYQDIYIYWGLHFTSMPRPAEKTDRTIIAGLIASHDLWTRRLLTTEDEEIRRNCIPIVRFIRSEIERRVPFERLKQLAAFLPESPGKRERRGA